MRADLRRRLRTPICFPSFSCGLSCAAPWLWGRVATFGLYITNSPLPMCHGWDLAYLVCLDRPMIGRRLESLAVWGAHPQTSPHIGPAAGRCARMRGRGRSTPRAGRVPSIDHSIYVAQR